MLDSSLYLDMSATERQKLLDYLVMSYFNSLPDENSWAFSRPIQFVPEKEQGIS